METTKLVQEKKEPLKLSISTSDRIYIDAITARAVMKIKETSRFDLSMLLAIAQNKFNLDLKMLMKAPSEEFFEEINNLLKNLNDDSGDFVNYTPKFRKEIYNER